MQLSFHDHLDHLEAAGGALGPALPPSLLLPRPSILKRGHGRLEVVFTKVTLFIHNEVEAISSSGVNIVLEGDRAIVRVDHMTWLLVKVADPLGKLASVGDGGRQEDIVDIVG